jgi:hypothetical protein
LVFCTKKNLATLISMTAFPPAVADIADVIVGSLSAELGRPNKSGRT